MEPENDYVNVMVNVDIVFIEAKHLEVQNDVLMDIQP